MADNTKHAASPVDAGLGVPAAPQTEDPNSVPSRMSHANQAKLFSAIAVCLFLVLASGFYCSQLGWTISDVVYFSVVTLTTVGYGDYNGSATPSSMQFTAFFGFLAVGVIGVAIGEIASHFAELHRMAKVKALESMAEAIAIASQRSDIEGSSENASLGDKLSAAGALMMGNQKDTTWAHAFSEWTKASALHRLVRVMIPVFIVGFIGTGVLLVTEEPDSDIMESESPATTGFYVSIITALSVGYGDFFPTSPMGQQIFIVFVPMSVILMFEALNELNEIVRFIRTTTD